VVVATCSVPAKTSPGSMLPPREMVAPEPKPEIDADPLGPSPNTDTYAGPLAMRK
jgi:hypothetical protein